MKYYIVIPAHNEEKFIGLTLNSLINQTILPSKVVVVNDNSTDKTSEIVESFSKKNIFISVLEKKSDAIHLPGSKVIQAFTTGFNTLDNEYDLIVKLDGDLILPHNYFETIIDHFKSDAKIGMVGGFAYIENNNSSTVSQPIAGFKPPICSKHSFRYALNAPRIWSLSVKFSNIKSLFFSM